MKIFLKFLKWTGITISILVVIAVLSVYALQYKTYDAPYPEITASKDSAIISRGEYLAFGPAHCSACHVPLEDQPAIANGEHLPFRGGFVFDLPVGKIYTPNITPDLETGIGKLQDKEIARSLRYGVGHDGRAMFDFMPFHNLSDADLTAVISYLRSQKPVEHKLHRADLNFVGKAINAFIIQPVGPEGEVKKSVQADTTVEYGEYLANNIANCKGCHSARSAFTAAYTGPLFAGGVEFEHPEKGFTLVTPNLTSAPKTGRITNWSQEQFINRFRQGKLIQESEMPWNEFRQFSDNDLKAIYKFLKSLKPVEYGNGQVLIASKQ